MRLRGLVALLLRHSSSLDQAPSARLIPAVRLIGPSFFMLTNPDGSSSRRSIGTYDVVRDNDVDTFISGPGVDRLRRSRLERSLDRDVRGPLLSETRTELVFGNFVSATAAATRTDTHAAPAATPAHRRPERDRRNAAGKMLHGLKAATTIVVATARRCTTRTSSARASTKSGLAAGIDLEGEAIRGLLRSCSPRGWGSRSARWLLSSSSVPLRRAARRRSS